MLPQIIGEVVPMPPCKPPKEEFEFIQVELPFSWGDIDDYIAEDAPVRTCFREEVGVEVGMLLDCMVDGQRKYILVGDVNVGTGWCGCCSGRISFVYKYFKYPLPH